MSAPDVAVIGAGAWGTALACLLASRGKPVRLWAYEPEVAECIAQRRENSHYLAGYYVPEDVEATSNLAVAVAGVERLILAAPVRAVRTILEQLEPHLPTGARLLSVTKGIDPKSLYTPSQTVHEIIPRLSERYAALSGPSFAIEVARQIPTAVVVAAHRRGVAQEFIELLTTSYFNLEPSDDVLGIELAGAVKNVIAIAAGVIDGLELGTNTRAALLTRGLADMTRLGAAIGASAHTFSGLAGIGDLVLTCTSNTSRNHAVGMRLARGERLDDIVRSMAAIAEGVQTTQAAMQLGDRFQVELPIIRAVSRMLFDGEDAKAIIYELLAADQPRRSKV